MKKFYIFRRDSNRFVSRFRVLDSATPEQIELAFQQTVEWSCIAPAEEYYFVDRDDIE